MKHPSTKYYKHYYIHDNGDRPFLIYISKHSNDNLYVFKRTSYNDDITRKDYDMCIHHIKNPKRVWIGHSPKIPMTEYSGGYGSKFKGNTILVELQLNKYMYIGPPEIYTFTSKDTIHTFISPVGNNDVPYPYAFGTTYLYSLFTQSYIQLKYIQGNTIQDTLDNAIRYDGFFNSLFNDKKPNITIQEFYKIMQQPIEDVSFKTIKQISKILSVSPAKSKRETVERIKNLRNIQIVKLNHTS